MTRLLISAAVFFGAWFAWSFLHLPAWAPVVVLGQAVPLKAIVAGALSLVAFSGHK